MVIIYLALGWLAVWTLVQLWPVTVLTYIDAADWNPAEPRWTGKKIVDVRDASEYWQNAVPGSINISIGRLPVVWRKDLKAEDEIILLGRSGLQRKKAARILARRGFRHLYAVKGCHWPLAAKRQKLEHPPCYYQKG